VNYGIKAACWPMLRKQTSEGKGKVRKARNEIEIGSMR